MEKWCIRSELTLSIKIPKMSILNERVGLIPQMPHRVIFSGWKYDYILPRAGCRQSVTTALSGEKIRFDSNVHRAQSATLKPYQVLDTLILVIFQVHLRVKEGFVLFLPLNISKIP